MKERCRTFFVQENNETPRPWPHVLATAIFVKQRFPVVKKKTETFLSNVPAKLQCGQQGLTVWVLTKCEAARRARHRARRARHARHTITTGSRSPAKRHVHLSYENIWIYPSINFLFICAITRAFPSEPPNVNPDSGTPPRVFYRPMLVLVSF